MGGGVITTCSLHDGGVGTFCRFLGGGGGNGGGGDGDYGGFSDSDGDDRVSGFCSDYVDVDGAGYVYKRNKFAYGDKLNCAQRFIFRISCKCVLTPPKYV